MLVINHKEDILIPFKYIGDDKWIPNVMKILEAFAYCWGEKLQAPIPTEELNALEVRIGTTLPENLKLFYQIFGLADIGEQLIEIDEIDWLKNELVKTPEIIAYFSINEKKMLSNLVCFSNYLGNGNKFCFHHETKEIYYFDYGSKPFISKIFPSVDEYLKSCLIFVQNDLYGEETTQEQVEEWTETMILQFYKNERINKWKS